MQNILSFLILVPLLALLATLFIPSIHIRTFRWLTLVAILIQLALLVMLIANYIPSGGIQFVERYAWITLDLGSWGILKAEYLLGVDGLSLPMIGLTVVVMLIACISSWNVLINVKGYFSL